MSEEMERSILYLTSERLDALTDALLDFKSMSDAQAWIGAAS
jgi:hypothetical protein